DASQSLRFQTMKCAPSALLTTSTAWMRLSISWPMRWNTRSAPLRSTRTVMPGNFASNVLPNFSATGRAMAVWKARLPPFLAPATSSGVIGEASACALIGAANTPAAIAVAACSTWRLEKRPLLTVDSLSTLSHPEQPAVARLDLFAHALDAGGILLHGFDLAQGLAPGLLLHLRMHRTHAAEIDDHLLALGREAIALEQPRRVGIGRIAENSIRADDRGNAFAGIDDLDRPARFLDLEQVVFAAIRAHRPLA